jgi:3-oxoacyl-[acyl-carrier protein] reductase
VSQKVTLITGTSRGIGHRLASHLLAEGHRVYGCSRSECDLEHPAYVHTRLDVCDAKGAADLFERIEREAGRLDHLINNAAVARLNHSLLTPVSTVRDAFEVNAIAPFLFAQEAARLMKKGSFGRILNFTTAALPLGLAGNIGYLASKAALDEMTRVLARDLGNLGITVNGIGPSFTELGLAKKALSHFPEAIQRQPIPRPAREDEIFAVVDFFLSEAASMVTGQIVYLGGA